MAFKGLFFSQENALHEKAFADIYRKYFDFFWKKMMPQVYKVLIWHPDGDGFEFFAIR